MTVSMLKEAVEGVASTRWQISTPLDEASKIGTTHEGYTAVEMTTSTPPVRSSVRVVSCSSGSWRISSEQRLEISDGALVATEDSWLRPVTMVGVAIASGGRRQ
ncbi:putative serine/arginine repetitive matrix protein 1 isoform X1 [Iris pallida]|uniref:Serine/arginine repetitive matrix protein 1 isoform X1 n=1 Tax=Iris pallida TaxID=29817 RepID=A0AAX6FC33_IRIPA|nr:putative serine/arginine repetitive matrix protein 1 isoform X1 [Iris pallida]